MFWSSKINSTRLLWLKLNSIGYETQEITSHLSTILWWLIRSNIKLKQCRKGIFSSMLHYTDLTRHPSTSRLKLTIKLDTREQAWISKGVWQTSSSHLCTIPLGFTSILQPCTFLYCISNHMMYIYSTSSIFVMRIAQSLR